jgi:hypothetical protein
MRLSTGVPGAVSLTKRLVEEMVVKARLWRWPRAGRARAHGQGAAAAGGRPAAASRSLRRLLRAAVALPALLLLIVVAAWPAAPAAQAAGSVQALRFDVALAVQPGGDVLVRETQQIAFQGGPFHHGYRRIPLARLDGIRDVQVGEADRAYQPGSPAAQAPFTFAISGPTSGGSGTLVIDWWFPSTANATRTFVITYRAVGAVRYYPGGDQLRWQAIPPDLGYPVAQASVRLTLPAEVPAGGWKVAAYPERYTARGGESAAGTTASWQAANIPSGQGYEIRAQWPHGLVPGNPPSWQAAADAIDQRNENLRPVLTLAFGATGVLIPLFAALGMLLVWYSHGRDPAIGPVPAELDEPPSDLPPGLVGTLVDGHADVHDVIATVMDLAARGIIAIREVQDPALLGSSRDFELELLRPEALQPSSPLELRPYERAILQSFFAHANPVRLSQLGSWFRVTIPFIQRALHREVAAAGLFDGNPEDVQHRYAVLGTSLLVLGFVLAGGMWIALGDLTGAAAWPGAGLAIAGLIVRFAAPSMPRRTAAGALEAARWRAYARFLAKAPPDLLAADPRHTLRTEQMAGVPAAVAAGTNGLPATAWEAGPNSPDSPDSPDSSNHLLRRGLVFERTLPYAIALGLNREWVRKFADVGTPVPRWFAPGPAGLPGTPPIIIGGPMWGGPWLGPMGPMGPYGAPRSSWHGQPGAPGQPAPQGSEPDAGGLQGASDRAAGGVQGASDSLADLLSRVSEVLSHGGGSGWSGGGGGGFGGGSGGGGGGFS